MSGWRETIKGRSEGGTALVGSFRGARFVVPESDATFGRRGELHEYPLRDTPWFEDLGRKARQFAIDVFVDSSLGDYLAARDALIKAIEEEGLATLIHPWYGTMTVALIEPATVKESTREGGRATFHLVLGEAGELLYPASGADTAALVEDQADRSLAAVMGDFAQVFNVSGLPAWSLDEITAGVNLLLGNVEGAAGWATGTISGLIRSPGGMAAAIVGAIQRLGATTNEPGQAVAMYKPLFSAGADSPATPATTPVRERQAQDMAAVQRLTQQTAVIEAARSASQAEYQSRDDALATAALLQDALDTRMEATDPVTNEPVSDEVYQALAELRAVAGADLRARGARLPELAEYKPLATLPALVIAHQLYGDATRADEITARNRIRHPGFVPGGEELEIVNA